MLLRLRIHGFKNIREAELRLGPVTCFVGPNGVGKSNIFDAIHFIKRLAETDIQSAAQSVRSPVAGSFGPADLFWRPDDASEMSFEADMLVPHKVEDDFGRGAEPATTLLRYEIALGLSGDPGPRLVLKRESLHTIRQSDAKATFGFTHSTAFRRSAVKPTRRTGPLISTSETGGEPALMLHQDGGSRGRAVPAGKSPRTVVGGTNAAEYPTVLAARREMSSWQTLHLEPSVMRAPDLIGGESRIDEHGGHIAGTLGRLSASDPTDGQTLAEAANRLAALVADIRSLRVDRDETRQQLHLLARLRGCDRELGTRSLSDGTLRFLALVTMQLDPEAASMLCMEEPENGIHPGRIPAMVELLHDYAVDAQTAVGEDNPPRQVVLNTHSPDVVRHLKIDEVLFVDAVDGPDGRHARVAALEGGWRRGQPTVPKKRVADFVGGSPIGDGLAQQLDLPLKFGTAQ